MFQAFTHSSYLSRSSFLPTRLSGLHPPSPIPLTYPILQTREIRKGKAKKKPKYSYKTDLSGQIIYPTSLIGYDEDQLETFNKWLKRTAENTRKQLGTGMGDRFINAMNGAIGDYFNTNFGTRMTKVKERAKVKRIIKRKDRKEKNLWKKIEEWNLLEDKKEDKIYRDQRRIYREKERIPFSFKVFLREQREKKRKPIVIEDEETFRKRLEEDQKKYLFDPPKAVRRKYRRGTQLGYWKRVNRDYVEPFLREVRRKGRIAQLVEEREDAIARLKWSKQVEEQRKKHLEERQKKNSNKSKNIGIMYLVLGINKITCI